MDTITSRRALLGAMALTPVAVAVPAPALGALSSTTEWDAAFAIWEKAHHAAYVAAPTDRDDDDALCDAEGEAWRRLMATPAPHNKALHWKVNFLWGDSNGNEYCDQWSADIVDHVVADARRLARDEEERI